MKILLDWIPFIQPYPDWVKILVILYGLGGAIVFGVLIFYYPPEEQDTGTEFVIDEIRIIDATEENDVVFDILCRNPSEEPVNLVALLLSFYEDEKPQGGLQSRQSISATYSVTKSGNGEGLNVTVSDSTEIESLSTTSIEHPFMGQTYVELQIPLVQSMAGRSTDRFRVRLDATQLNLNVNNRLEATIRYNGQELTEPYVALTGDD